MNRLFLTVLMLISFTAVWTKPITKLQAQQYAETWLSSMTMHIVSMKNIESVGNGTASYYIVNMYPQGWVIISGDDTAQPIIGYSTKGCFQTKKMPENLKYVMKEFAREVNEVARSHVSAHDGWKHPYVERTRANGESVEPLIAVHWNQDGYFNKYCPGGTNNKALVGCVAVAMSQAMSVQRYPDRPKGSVSYHSAEYGTLSIKYDEERAYNWDHIMTGANNYDEVARLLMHAGYSVQMDYGVDGSGVPVNQLGRVVTALSNNFGYPTGVRQVKRDTYVGDWSQLIKNELNAGRVVVYNGVDSKQSSGHSWDIDGFDVNGLFHCNWGWGGSADGYFSLNGLGYGSLRFDETHIAIVGIGAPTQTLRSISLSNYDIEEQLPAGCVVGKIQVNNEDVPSSYTVNVHGSYSRNAGGYQSVPFAYHDGMLVTTEPLTKNNKWTVEITVSDGTSNLTQGFVINVTGLLSLADATSLSYDRSTQMFTLATKNNVSYTLKNAQGLTIKNGKLSPLPQMDFYRNQLTTGENQLTLTSTNESITLTINK